MLAASRRFDQLRKGAGIQKLLQGLRDGLCRRRRHGSWGCCHRSTGSQSLDSRWWLCGCKCRNLFPDEFQLILGELLPLQNALKIKECLQALLGGGIKRAVGKVIPCRSDQGLQVPMKRFQIHIWPMARRRRLRPD